MKGEIIAVGTELLLGQIANTNAQFISQEIAAAGINIYYHSVVGDNEKRLMELLKLATSRSDIIILTGGLGPTDDDMTKETVSKFLGLELLLHSESHGMLMDFFKKLNKVPSENNLKQVFMPEDCMVLNNHKGTAPGCIIEKDNKVYVILPGPPIEMQPMFIESVMPFLRNLSTDGIIKSEVMRFFGIGESSLATLLDNIIKNQVNPTVAPYAKNGEVTLRVTCKHIDEKIAVEKIEEMEKEILSIAGEYFYGYGEDGLFKTTADLLINKNISISFAESCTGGLVSKRITDVNGISKVFKGSIIAYDNQVKTGILGVKEKTIEKFGAVSENTAHEMAINIKKLYNTDIGLSITGIAGPEGGTDEKPVGTVFICVCFMDTCQTKKLLLGGNRERIRNMAAMTAIDMVRRLVL